MDGEVGGGSGVFRDRWFLFNDAEVKPFDPHQIPAECFGGELTSKTYDQLTDKFMDFSFEKTNSAYMLFYERLSSIHADAAAKSGIRRRRRRRRWYICMRIMNAIATTTRESRLVVSKISA